MVENGVHTGQGTLLVGGAGGEHPTMNVDERKAVMTAAMEAADGEAPVLTSVQHTDWRVIIELANHAHEAGLGGVQLGPTYYYEPTEGDAYRLFELVANESDVTIMIYHTWWEGLTMSLGLLDDLAAIDTVRALKWSAPNESLYRDGLVNLADRLVCIDNSGQQIFSHIMGARRIHHPPQRVLAPIPSRNLESARATGLRSRTATPRRLQMEVDPVARQSCREHRW